MDITDVTKKIALLYLPVVIIRTYRIIPERVRAVWSMGSSSSGTALACAYRTGNGGAAVARYGNPVRALVDQGWDSATPGG